MGKFSSASIEGEVCRHGPNGHGVPRNVCRRIWRRRVWKCCAIRVGCMRNWKRTGSLLPVVQLNLDLQAPQPGTIRCLTSTTVVAEPTTKLSLRCEVTHEATLGGGRGRACVRGCERRTTMPAARRPDRTNGGLGHGLPKRSLSSRDSKAFNMHGLVGPIESKALVQCTLLWTEAHSTHRCFSKGFQASGRS